MRNAIAFVALFSLFATVRPGSISGVVLGPDRKPVKDARISISGSGEVKTTGDNGRFAFLNLSAGHYDVMAEAPGFESFRNRYVVRAGDDTAIELKLARAPQRVGKSPGLKCRKTLTVRDATYLFPMPVVPGVKVRLMMNGATVSGTTNSEGQIPVTDIADGTWSVEATKEGYSGPINDSLTFSTRPCHGEGIVHLQKRGE